MPTNESVDTPMEEITMIEPHGVRKVKMTHTDFHRRFLDKYGRRCGVIEDIKAVECTCKSIATTDSEDPISIVYGINIIKFDNVSDLTVEKIDNAYQDCAIDAVKRLSTCIDIYYKNRDVCDCEKEPEPGDGEVIPPKPGENDVTVNYVAGEDLVLDTKSALGELSFTGSVNGEINITLTPKYCTLSGFVTDPTQVVTSEMVYELPVHTLEDINNEVKNLQVTPEDDDAYIEVRLGTKLLKTISLVVVDTTAVEFTTNVVTAFATEETKINPIEATGTINKPVTVTVMPSNCSVSGFASRPNVIVTGVGSKYVFQVANVESLNNELANLTIVSPMVGSATLTVECLGESYEFTYPVVPQPVNHIAVTADTTTTINEGESATVSLSFSGTMDAGSVTVKVTPIDCTFKGVKSDPDAVYTTSNPYTFTTKSMMTLNEEFAQVEVTPTGTKNSDIHVAIDKKSDVAFVFTTIPTPEPSEIEVQSDIIPASVKEGEQSLPFK